MKFSSAANKVWLASICVFLVAFLMASGTPPISVALIVVGFLIMAIGSNLAFAKSRAARGKPDSVVASLGDLVQTRPRDWLLMLASAGIGGALALVGVLLASSATG